MKLASIIESINPSQVEPIIGLLNHKYSSMSPSIKDRFSRLIQSGALPDHNISFVMNIVKSVQSAISLEGTIDFVDGYLLDFDALRARGPVFFVADNIQDLMHSIDGYLNSQGVDAGEHWQGYESRNDDILILTANGFDDVSNVQNAKQLKLAFSDYNGVVGGEYGSGRIYKAGDQMILVIGDNQYEMSGVARVVATDLINGLKVHRSEIDTTYFEKYGLQVVTGQSW